MFEKNQLHFFYQNEPMRKAVQSYLVQMVNEEALKKVFKGEDTKGLKDAMEIINKAFIELDESYGAKPKSTTQSSE